MDAWRKISVLYAVLAVLLLCSEHGFAAEVIITNPQKSSLDKRFEYPKAVLEEVLKRASPNGGDFEIQRFPNSVTRNRALHLLIDGDIDIFSAPTRPVWEESVLPVRIPIRKGILGYRLFLINESDQSLFSEIMDLEQLKALPLGGGTQWSTSQVFRKLGFELTGHSEYEALFAMLKHRRFLYFPRGINEIFRELDDRREQYPEMKIEDELALYLPLPTYFFVTPKRPALAKQVESGLKEIIRDGTLNDLFNKYHQESIDRANLSDRRIFKLNNPDLSVETPLNEADFWYSPSASR